MCGGCNHVSIAHESLHDECLNVALLQNHVIITIALYWYIPGVVSRNHSKEHAKQAIE